MQPVSRREFTRLLLVGAGAASGLAGCGSDADYTDEDEATLLRRMQEERLRAGQGRLGPLVFRGYRGLADLPYFELDEEGRLRSVVSGLPPIVDIHTHLGFSFLFAPEIDLLQGTERTRHLLDCDGSHPGCRLDLDVYMNDNFDSATKRQMRLAFVRRFFLGGGAADTHTIPNLLVEMDGVGVGRSALLPIATGLPFEDDVTRLWLRAVENAGAGERLIPFASVHPRDAGRLEKLRSYADAGVRGVKLHPEMQRFFPDEDGAMEIYGECERLGLPVLFHAGRSGIEPGFMRKYALMHRYETAVSAFPRVQFVFGHSGARDADDAMAIARRRPNVWLGLASVGASRIEQLVEAVGADRLLFGSDWPFYHQATTLAKILLVTEGRESLRAPILRDNADRLFASARATRVEPA